jgi:hypothetical protein
MIRGHLLYVKVDISELPIPPTILANAVCTNPTECVSAAWGGTGTPGFYWDPHYVLLAINHAGAPSTGPASMYSGPHVLVVKTDGTTFPNGDAWKCITCGETLSSDVNVTRFSYPPPHEFPTASGCWSVTGSFAAVRAGSPMQ